MVEVATATRHEFQPHRPSTPADQPPDNSDAPEDEFDWTVEDLKAFIEEYHPTNLGIDLSIL